MGISTVSASRHIRTASALFRVDDEDERVVVFRTDSVEGGLTIELAQENIDALREMAGERKVAVLADIRKTNPSDADARALYRRSELPIVAAAALVSSPFSRLIANLFCGILGTKFPIRVFKDEREASSWLTLILDEAELEEGAKTRRTNSHDAD